MTQRNLNFGAALGVIVLLIALAVFAASVAP